MLIVLNEKSGLRAFFVHDCNYAESMCIRKVDCDFSPVGDKGQFFLFSLPAAFSRIKWECAALPIGKKAAILNTVHRWVLPLSWLIEPWMSGDDAQSVTRGMPLSHITKPAAQPLCTSQASPVRSRCQPAGGRLRTPLPL